MELENLIWPIYELAVYDLSRPPPPSRCNTKCRCVSCAGLCLIAAFITCACIAAVHVAHVGTAGCMTSVLQSFRANLTEESVFRFKVVNYIAKEPYLSSDPSFSPDYVWSGTREAVTLGQASRVAHGFPVWNFTFPLGCEAAPGSGLDVFYTPVLPPDVPVVNAAIYGMPGIGGYLINARTNEDWGWGPQSGASTSVFGGSSAGSTYAFAERLAGVFRLLFTYFLMSTTTAFLVRLWFVAMPAFMYPVLACIGRWAPVPPDPRILDTHFPWIGGYAAAARLQDEAAAADATEPQGDVDAQGGHRLGGAADGAPAAAPVAVAVARADPGGGADLDAGLMPEGGPRRRRQQGGFLGAILDAAVPGRRPTSRLASGATAALVWAHLQQLVLALILYEAMASFAGNLAFMYKSFPSELLLLVWAVFLVAEGFSVVFVRSLLSMTVFPRVHFILFSALYYYWVAWSYPAITAAAVAYLLAVLALAAACLIWFEAPAYGAGRVSATRPRAVLVLLPTAVTGRGLAGPVEHWAVR